MARPDDKIGPYTLIRKLGRGAFGVVWLAEKRTVIATSKVALKFPNDEDVDLEAIKQEASLWIHASGHPNVLTFIDADVYDGQVVIVSEYAPDGSLSNWLETHGGKAPTIDAAVEMVFGILAGLEHLHKRGIIHRDIKPDNILLQNESPRLADFGIARILKTTSKSTVATGTPAYMPPEAFDGKRNERTDIWSLGVIFYQLLTGTLPFPQTDMPSLLMAIVSREPEPLPLSIPEPVRELIGRTLNKDPKQRFESGGQMRIALRDAVGLSGSLGDQTRGHGLPVGIGELPTQVAGKESPAASTDATSSKTADVASDSDANERSAEKGRLRREAEEEQRKEELGHSREEGQRRQPDYVSGPQGPPSRGSAPQGPPSRGPAPQGPPLIYQPPPRSKRLMWIVLSVSVTLLLGIIIFLKYNSDRSRSSDDASSSDTARNTSYPGSTPSQATPYPSQSTTPTATPPPPSVALRLRLLDQGASAYSAAVGLDVILQSSTQNFSQRTDSLGFVTFNSVPCDEEVELSYRSDLVERKLLRIKRYLPCGSSLIDLGIYSSTLGERLGASESDLDGEIRAPR